MNQKDFENLLKVNEQKINDLNDRISFHSNYWNESEKTIRELKENQEQIKDRYNNLRVGIIFIVIIFTILIITSLLYFDNINRNIDYEQVTYKIESGLGVNDYSRKIYTNIVCEEGVIVRKYTDKFTTYGCMNIIDNECSGMNKFCLITKKVMKFKE